MVKLENVSYEIKNKTLINNISSCFEKGKIHLILGPNGAGKSTLIKLISGELKPKTGKILFEDVNLQQISLNKQAQFRAVLSQSIELNFPLSVWEVVLMGRYPHFEGKPQLRDLEICEKSMELFNLLEMKSRDYLTLSGGEKQRVQFARVFAQIWEPVKEKPRLLLLDEPLTFLDIFYQYDLMKKINNFLASNPDLTIIGVVHDLNIATKFSHNLLLIDKGSILSSGSPGKVLTPQNVLECFKVSSKSYMEDKKTYVLLE